MATSAVRAVCSWIAVRTRGSPGLRAKRPAMVKPRPTEIVTSASATIPEARLASHQACCGEARVHAATPSRSASARGTVTSKRRRAVEGPDKLDLAASWTRKPPLPDQEPARALGAGEQRRLGERLRLERCVAERGGADQAGPRGLAGRGIEQVVREPSVGVPPHPDVEARGGDPPVTRA